jgi:hypothetical protein
MLFPEVKSLDTPKCSECDFQIQDATCGCGLPKEDPKNISYINHCWNCGTEIDSIFCVESSTPGMGYHCKLCGKDLKEWKENMGLLPV